MNNMSADNGMRELSKQRILDASEKLSSLGYVKSRSQFGGYGLCCEETMFALVSDGELYLRSNKKLEPYFKREEMERFVYEKRGAPVPMEYYRVNDVLWENDGELLLLAEGALSGAKEDKKQDRVKRDNRLKDLPNLTISIERLLWRAGIRDAESLKECGAIIAYLKLLEVNSSLDTRVLFALAGAIEGYHVATLNDVQKSELIELWKKHADIQLN